MDGKEKLAIADAFTMKKIGKSFNSLPNVNDLSEADNSEDVIEMAKARIHAQEHINDDIPLDDDDEDEQDDYYGIGNFDNY